MFTNTYKKISFAAFTASNLLLIVSIIIKALNLTGLNLLNTICSILFWLLIIVGIIFLFLAKNISGGGIFNFFTAAKLTDTLLLVAVLVYLVLNILKLYSISGYLFVVFIYLFELHCIQSLN